MTDEKDEAAAAEEAPAPEPEPAPPPVPKMYKLVTVNGETKLDEKTTDALTFSELRNMVEEMAGAPVPPFHVVKVPEDGKPTVVLCETAAGLSEMMVELTTGEEGTIMVFRGDRVSIGSQRTTVPLTIGDEEIAAVEVSQPDPPEDAPPAEDTPDEPEQPAEEAPAEG